MDKLLVIGGSDAGGYTGKVGALRIRDFSAVPNIQDCGG
jgi:hypothetical protein